MKFQFSSGYVERPTSQLRFRVDPGTSTKPPVLQQWWEFIPPTNGKNGEWKDVPIAVEQDDASSKSGD